MMGSKVEESKTGKLDELSVVQFDLIVLISKIM